jgi:hypothetical protein
MTCDADVPVAVPAHVINKWLTAQSLARSCSVPCFLMLSKQDLLYDSLEHLADGLSAATVESVIRSQFLNHRPTDDTADRHSIASSAHAPPASEDTSSASGTSTSVFAASLDVLDSESSSNKVVELLIEKAFPELDFDDDKSAGLGDSVHICFSFFCSEDGAVLCKGGTLPVAKWQGQVPKS